MLQHKKVIVKSGLDKAEVIATAGNPVVYAKEDTFAYYGAGMAAINARWKEPVELWKSPPLGLEMLSNGTGIGEPTMMKRGRILTQVQGA